MESVAVKEFIQDDASGRQPMVRIVLIVVVSVAVRSYALAPKLLIFVLDIAPAEPTSLASYAGKHFFKSDPCLAFQVLHHHKYLASIQLKFI